MQFGRFNMLPVACARHQCAAGSPTKRRDCNPRPVVIESASVEELRMLRFNPTCTTGRSGGSRKPASRLDATATCEVEGIESACANTVVIIDVTIKTACKFHTALS